LEVTVNRLHALNALVTTLALLASGCAITLNNPGTQSHYQILTSGHTGCVPDENQLSNLNIQHNGDGTWNAECKNKTYLCSVTGQEQEVVSCAPAAN
jgi:putative lipase involved disintegration of autophagic bodies